MSMSPEDRLVNLLSRWLARHVGNAELLAAVDAIDRTPLSPVQAEAVDWLLDALRRAAPGERGQLEVAVREALEALALGG